MLELRGDASLPKKPLGPDGRGQLRSEHFHGHLSVVLDVVGKVDGGHATSAELPLNQVPVGECRLQAFLVLHNG